jgi:hypothetical protein
MSFAEVLVGATDKASPAIDASAAIPICDFFI